MLNLWGFRNHNALPEEIGTLIHLRYLGIRLTNIRELPHSIGNLRNLLTFDYRQIRDGVGSAEVPSVLWNMVQLRHVCLPWGAMYFKDKLELDGLRELRTLWGMGGNWITTELVRSSSTIQKLAIANVCSEKQLEAVFRCPSIVSDSMRSLTLSWFSVHSDYQSSIKLPALELSHCEHLQSIILKGRIKEGLSLCFPPNLTKLELYFLNLKAKIQWKLLGDSQT